MPPYMHWQLETSNKCGADLEAEFVKDVRMIRENVEGELAKER